MYQGIANKYVGCEPCSEKMSMNRGAELGVRKAGGRLGEERVREVVGDDAV